MVNGGQEVRFGLVQFPELLQYLHLGADQVALDEAVGEVST